MSSRLPRAARFEDQCWPPIHIKGETAETSFALVNRNGALVSRLYLRKCNPVHGGQMIPSYSFSRTSASSSNQCWTFIDVVGQVKTKWRIVKYNGPVKPGRDPAQGQDWEIGDIVGVLERRRPPK